MRPSKKHLPIDSVYPLRGLNVREPSTIGDPNYSPALLNVLFSKGLVQKRKGYLALEGTADAGLSLVGDILGLMEFEDVDGDRTLVCVTSLRQYRFDSVLGWVDITQRDDLGDRVEWTGGETDYLSWAVGTDFNGKYLFITNGKDFPLRWDGISDRFEQIPINITSFNSCKTLAVHSNRLVFGSITHEGQENPQSILWTAAGDFTEWQGEGSGQTLFADLRGEIVKLLPLGGRLIVYTKDDIGACIYVGGEMIFSFEVLSQNISLLSARTIVSVGAFHVFMGREDFYAYDGVRMPQPIGGLVQREYKEELDLNHVEQNFGYHDPVLCRIYWQVKTNLDYKTYVLAYDLYNFDNNVWSIFEYDDPPLAMGSWSRHSDIKWSTIEGRWLDHWWPWNQGSSRQGFPVRIQAGTSVVLCDETKHEDNGVSYNSYWDSKDFTIPQIYKSLMGRWLEIELEVRGEEVEVLYSIDGGFTTTTVETISCRDWQRTKVFCDVVSEQFRVRLQSTSYFEFRWLRVWFKPGGIK